MTWQIASELVFSWLVEDDTLSIYFAGLRHQAETKGRQEDAVLRFSSAIVENQRDGTPGRDPNLRRSISEFRGDDADFSGLGVVQETAGQRLPIILQPLAMPRQLGSARNEH